LEASIPLRECPLLLLLLQRENKVCNCDPPEFAKIAQFVLLSQKIKSVTESAIPDFSAK